MDNAHLRLHELQTLVVMKENHEKNDFMKRLNELYLPSDKVFVLVDVPEMQFVMIDGEGNPDDEVFTHAMQWLISMIYPIKIIAKERMSKGFVGAPLECLW